MLTCENCGVVFKQSGTQEVVSARVLCADCTEKRRLEKAKRAEGQRAPVATAAASTPARSAPAPRNDAPARASTRTAAKASGVRSRREREAEVEDDEQEPQGRGRRGRRSGGGGRSAVDQAVRMGFMIAGAFVLIAIGVFVYSSNKRSDREHQQQQHVKAIEDFAAEMRALDPNVAADAEKIRARAKEQEALWTPEAALASEIMSMISRSTATLQAAKENEVTVKALEEIEQTIQLAPSKTSDDLVEVRRRINNLGPKVEFAGKAIVERYNAVKRTASDAYAKKLAEEARAFVAANPAATGDALNRYKKAEDEVTILFDKAGTDKDEAAKAGFSQLLKEIYAESNAICARAFTDAAISQVPLRDLLTPAQEKVWKAATVKGFDHGFPGGVLKIVGPDKDTKSRALMSIGDDEVWRDFVIDMTLERQKGKIELFFRLGKNVDGVESFILKDENAPAGKPLHLVASVIGGRFKITAEGEATPLVDRDIPISFRRKGAFGLAVSPETEVTFTKMGARVLR